MIRCQVTRFLANQNIKSLFFRGLHNDNTSTPILYPLKCRNLLQVAGIEAEIFLQGLITNDMRHFEEGARSMYAMFLNTKGRILYDVLVHKKPNEDAFMIECDKNVAPMLEKHLKIYKLKRKVDILNVSKDFNVWALVKCPETIADIDINGRIHTYKDPRLVDLGSRMVTSTATSNDEIKEAVGKDTHIEETEDGYRYLRFKLGVSEGAEDLPPSTCFPLEANCDYLHGVSFFKGCYIGQELTARVHHTGVVRKRIMPLKFSENVTELDLNSVLSANNDPKSNVGKIKSYLKDYGLGLVRIKEGLEAKALNIGKYTVELVKPSWWPLEAPKEKQTLIKE